MTDISNLPSASAPKEDVKIGRLRAKLAQRDKRIVGLVSRVAALESALATQVLLSERLPKDVEKAVQRALCNVRMIPVIGMSGDRIVEVTATVAPRK